MVHPRGAHMNASSAETADRGVRVPRLAQCAELHVEIMHLAFNASRGMQFPAFRMEIVSWESGLYRGLSCVDIVNRGLVPLPRV